LTGNASTATTATTATKVTVTNDYNASGYHYITFVDGSSGNRAIKVDSNGILYNPYTNTLSVTNFSGTATNANNVAVTNDTTTNATRYITFVDSTSGNNAIKVDSSQLLYNPYTNTLIVANLQGNASTATNATSAGSVTNSVTFNNGAPIVLYEIVLAALPL